jgi:hypothetical protein
MMTDIPAFPLEMVYTQENEKFNGMTLRDYFAAKAMQAIVSRSDFEFEDSAWGNAYDMADAMLKAREQK